MRRSAVIAGIAMLAPLLAARAQSGLSPTAQLAVERRAAPYPVREVHVFGTDSARLVVDDSTMTGEQLRAHTWMFGPAVTAAEADSCPPEKVLGRRIARELWRNIGRPQTMSDVVVRVQGTKGLAKFSYVDMHYSIGQLRAPWVGDASPR